jgi:hypothetical protein
MDLCGESYDCGPQVLGQEISIVSLFFSTPYPGSGLSHAFRLHERRCSGHTNSGLVTWGRSEARLVWCRRCDPVAAGRSSGSRSVARPTRSETSDQGAGSRLLHALVACAQVLHDGSNERRRPPHFLHDKHAMQPDSMWSGGWHNALRSFRRLSIDGWKSRLEAEETGRSRSSNPSIPE